MAYRDDSDAVHHRAVALQHELEQIQRTLKERELELERLRKVKRGRPPTIPELKLEDTVPEKLPTSSGPIDRRRAILAAAREWLGVLDDKTLVMVGSIIEELATEVERRDDLVDQLLPIVDQIRSTYQPKK
ncbi:MAG TPA: hypothetical protein VGM90_30220 [Kofleriaceae bacterium]|jgi:hypothetical protein